MLVSKRVKRSTELILGGNFPLSLWQTPRPGNFSDRTPNNCLSGQSLSKFQPTVKIAPYDTEYDDPENAFANDDKFGDSEI